MTDFLPPEWAPQSAVMLTWPRADGDFARHFAQVEDNFLRIAVAISRHQPVHINYGRQAASLLARLEAAGARRDRVRIWNVESDDVWARDHGPAFVLRRRRGKTQAAIVDWGFNAWGGKYPPWDSDDDVPTRIAQELKLPVFYPRIVMEGGAVDFNGAGTVMTTTSCLLNRNRNPGVSKKRIEKYLRDFYGQKHVIWLGEGIEGDDTDGHIDDLARFIDERTIAIGIETNQRDPNFAILRKARRALDAARDQDGNRFNIVELPMPRPIAYHGQRVPATYVNFYFANRSLLVPTFGQRDRDRQAIAVLQKELPKRKVIGIDCRKLIWGLGAIHWFTQQQPTF